MGNDRNKHNDHNGHNDHIAMALANGFSPLLTLKEVAGILRMSHGYVRKLEYQKENPLRMVKVTPRRIFVRREDLEEFLTKSGLVSPKQTLGDQNDETHATGGSEPVGDGTTAGSQEIDMSQVLPSATANTETGATEGYCRVS